MGDVYNEWLHARHFFSDLGGEEYEPSSCLLGKQSYHVIGFQIHQYLLFADKERKRR